MNIEEKYKGYVQLCKNWKTEPISFKNYKEVKQ